MYGIQFYRKDIPHYYEIDNLTMNIIDMSEKLAGMYDGLPSWSPSSLRTILISLILNRYRV